VLLGAVVLGEALSPRVLVGMVIVLAGVTLAQRKPRAVPTPTESAPVARLSTDA